jgi:hypothetical protein
LARFREEDRRALFRAVDFFRAVFLADLALLADFRAPFRAVFLLDFLADRLAAFLRGALRLRAGFARVGDGSSKSLNDEGVEAGVGEGVLSMGNGSIQPDPDQPISMK